MRAAEQRHDLAIGEDDPVVVAGVHGRDDEPLGKCVQDRAPTSRAEPCPQCRMSDTIDRGDGTARLSERCRHMQW